MEIVISSGTRTVSSGQTLSSVEILKSGAVVVSNGGKLVSTFVYSGGKATISSGGSLNSATVYSAGSVFVHSKGVINQVGVSDKGIVYVSGGSIYSAGVGSSGTLEVFGAVSSGMLQRGYASNVNILFGGMMTLHNAMGSAVYVASGYVYVSSGATLQEAVIGNSSGSSKCAQVYIKPGGWGNLNAVYSNGLMVVSSAGSAYQTKVYSGGSFVAYSGGVVSNTKVSGGRAIIQTGGSASATTMESGYVTVFGQTSDGAYSGGMVYVSGGSTLGERLLGGEMRVSANGAEDYGYARNLTVQSAIAYFYSNTYLEVATVNADGKLYIYEGARASSVDVKTGGEAFIKSGAYVSGGSIYGSEAITSGGSALGIQVQLLGVLEVAGRADSCTVFSGGTAVVSGTGQLYDAVISSGAKLTVASSATAVVKQAGGFSATISGTDAGMYMKSGTVTFADLKKGTVVISSGAFLTNAYVSAGELVLDPGGQAGTVMVRAVSSAAGIDITSKSVLSYANVSGKSATVTVWSGGALNKADIMSSAYVVVYGRISSCTVDSGAIVVVSSGGYVTNAALATGAILSVQNFARASGLNVSSNGLATVLNGGSAMDVTIRSYGSMFINSGGTGGTGITVMNNGLLAVYGGTASGINVSSGGMVHVYSGGTAGGIVLSNFAKMEVNGSASNTQINGGTATVANGGTLVFSAASGGSVFCGSGGRMEGVLSSGCVAFFDGGTTNAMAIISGGRLTIRKNLTMSTGKLNFATGGNLDFDISDITVASASDVPYLGTAGGQGYDTYVANPSGTVFSLTVSSVQAEQTYVLASEASTFNKTITVLNISREIIGSLSLGDTRKFYDRFYTLNLDADNALTVTVSAAAPGPASDSASSDIDGNGTSDVLFQYTGGLGQIGFWMNGTSEWKSTNATHPTDVWEVLGAYDMNANGMADSVLVGNTEIAGIKGAFIGYYLDAEDYDSNWVNISYLTNSEGYVWKNKVGNLTGNDGMNSIVWHTTDIGALGVWTDGTDSWISLGAGYDSNWTLIGCGDFDGDGKDSVVMSYMNGAKYYTVDIDKTVNELATSDSGWEVRAIGDFAGDGKDDIVVFHKETGLVAMWADGDSSKWSQLGQLDPVDWFVVGAGDYTGDGKDDLLVRQYSSGMLGYYGAANMDDWIELGRGVDMSWTVIA